MPITRELKKRFMAIEDRLEKIEKKGGKTNGSPVSVEAVDASLIERLDMIEVVLQIPGERKGDTQIASAWRQTVETIMTKLEDRLKQVELRGAWTPDEAKDLEKRVKALQEQEVPNLAWVKGIEERVGKLERTPPPLNNIAQKMAEDIREHEVELFGTDGTPGLTQKIQDLNQTVKTLRVALGRVTVGIVVLIIITLLITLLF